MQALRKSKPHQPVVADSIIPGAQVIYMKTWGCSHNNSDGEYMAGQLAAYGYQITGEKNHVICIMWSNDLQNLHWMQTYGFLIVVQ